MLLLTLVTVDIVDKVELFDSKEVSVTSLIDFIVLSSSMKGLVVTPSDATSIIFGCMVVVILSSIISVSKIVFGSEFSLNKGGVVL